jgi:hypothetical protein
MACSSCIAASYMDPIAGTPSGNLFAGIVSTQTVYISASAVYQPRTCRLISGFHTIGHTVYAFHCPITVTPTPSIGCSSIWRPIPVSSIWRPGPVFSVWHPGPV